MDTVEQMGILGFLDPLNALNLRNRMRDSGIPDATLDQVNQLWDAYQDAILEKKLPPFTRGSEWLPTFNDMQAVTQLPKMTVSGFLTALRAHAADNATMQYLDPAQGQASRQKAMDTAKSILTAPAKVVQAATKPLIDTAADASNAVVGPLKWVAIGAASLALIYLTFQVAPIFTAAKKAAKKRKA